MSASGICKQAGDMQGNEPGYVQPRGRLHRVRAQSQSTGTSPASRHSIQILEPRSCSNSNSHVPAAIAVLQAVRVGGANVDVDPTTATVALGLDDGTSHKGEDGCGNFDRHDWELPKRRCRAKCHRAVDPFVQQLWARAGRRRLRWNLAAATTTWRTVPVPQVSGEGRNLRFKRKMTCEMKMQRRRKLRTTVGILLLNTTVEPRFWGVLCYAARRLPTLGYGVA